MILRGWKEISARIGKSPRWCHRWRSAKKRPVLPVSIVDGRVEAFSEHLDGWAARLVWMNMEETKRK